MCVRLLRNPILLASLLAMAACSSRPPEATMPDVIPAGKANWIAVEEDQPLAELSSRELSFPYRLTGHGPVVVEAKTVGSSVTAVFKPTPLVPDDRCGMELLRLRLKSADGKVVEVPATGYVQDNSDGQRGFRIELAKQGEKKLVIPAGATATVVFTQDVVLPK